MIEETTRKDESVLTAKIEKGVAKIIALLIANNKVVMNVNLLYVLFLLLLLITSCFFGKVDKKNHVNIIRKTVSLLSDINQDNINNIMIELDNVEYEIVSKDFQTGVVSIKHVDDFYSDYSYVVKLSNSVSYIVIISQLLSETVPDSIKIRRIAE